MTREEQIIILTNAQERAFKQIDLTEGCEMGTEDFARLIHVAEQLRWMTMPPETTVPEPETPAEPDPSDEPEPETGDDEEPAFKMEEVRAALAKARGRGVNVSEIIRSFDVNSFPEIPKNKYPDIMARLTEGDGHDA